MTRSDRPPLYTPVPGRRSRPANRQPSTINHLRLGLLVLLLLPAAALRGQTALDEAERLQFADGLYARDMHDLALQEYAALLRDFPGSTNSAVVHFRMADTYRRMGKLAEADAAYRRVFEDYPGSPVRLKAGLKRAELSLEGRQYQTAADRFRLVLNEKPPPAVAAPAFYFLGTALQKLGRSREAADAFEQAQRRYPSSSYRSYALLALGDLYGDGQGAWRGEAQAVQQALECYRLAAEQPATERVGAEALFQAAPTVSGHDVDLTWSTAGAHLLQVGQ